MGLRMLPVSTLMLLGCCRSAAAGPSVSSCGGQNDLLKDAKFTISPDPIDKGSPFTVTASGTLGAVLSAGSIVTDIEAKVTVFGHQLVDKSLHKTSPFSFSPGFAAGDTQLVVGPVSLPGHVPGKADVTGKVVIKDSKGAQVACVALDFHSDLFEEASALALPSAVPPYPLGGAANCGKSGDHMSDITASSSGGVFEGGGKLDEDITQMTFDTDLKLHVGFLPVPVKLEVPVSFTPGLKRGEVSFKAGPAKDHTSSSLEKTPTVPVTGEVTWNDASKEEIACVSLSEDRSELVV